MLFPLYDQERAGQGPGWVTFGLIIANILIFGFTVFQRDLETVVNQYGVVPGQILAGQNLENLVISVFLHAGLLHLLGNMWFLSVFGNNVEDNFGHIKFLIFYLLTGVASGLAHSFFVSADAVDLPAVGASGAISGVLAAYLILFPRHHIRSFVLIIFYPIFFYLPAFFYIFIWFFYQLLLIGAPTGVAYMAHIGGFIAGLALTVFFKNKKSPTGEGGAWCARRDASG